MNRYVGPQPLRVATWVDHERGVVEVAGEVDVYTTPELRAAVAEVQEKAQRPHLVVLLGELTFCDSSGLGVLVGAHKRAVMAGGRVALVGTRENLLRILRVTGLAKLLPTFEGTDAAFTWLDSWAGR